MKLFTTWSRVGVVLLLMNEVRGILVVLSVLSAWTHAGRAEPRPHQLPVAARLAPPASRVVTPEPAATAPAQPSGSNGAIIRPQ
jgi:hypothetical protein